jgi:hypothetical protein
VGNPRRALFTAKLEALEVARGNDGWLRGNPEPVLLLAAGRIGPKGPHLESRHIARFPTPDVIPTTALPVDQLRLTADHRGARSSFFLLALALEHDSGEDISRIYGALESLPRWSFVPHGPDPEPLDLGEACVRLGGVATRIEPMLDGRHLTFEEDEMVGGAFIGAPTHESKRATVRLHFLSPDEKNDWTARVILTVRGQR